MKNYLFYLTIILLTISCQKNEEITLDQNMKEIQDTDDVNTRKSNVVGCDCELTITELDEAFTVGTLAFLNDSDECGSFFFSFGPSNPNPQTIDLIFPNLSWPNHECLNSTILNGTELILDGAVTINDPSCYNLKFELDCGGNIGVVNVSRQDEMGLRLFELAYNGVGCDANPVSICHPPIPDGQYCSFCE